MGDESAKKMHVIARVNYKLRMMAIYGLSVLFTTSMWGQDRLYTAETAITLVTALLWPHILYFTLYLREDSYEGELQNLVVDGFVAGMAAVICSFDPWFVLCAAGTLIINTVVNAGLTLTAKVLSLAVVTAASLQLHLQNGWEYVSNPYSIIFGSIQMMAYWTFIGKTTHTAILRLRRLHKELAQIDKQKTMFFQNVSHELRTPLTLILNPLEVEAQKSPENQNLNVSVRNARRLLRLVNQLLDVQKLEAGKVDLKLRPVNLIKLMHLCGDYFASASSTKEIDFNVTQDGHPLNEQSALFIQGEIDAIEKVIFNFLSNALKYTPRGGKIELGLESTGGSDDARIFVKDSGPGISQEGQEKLFRVFSQLDETTTREYEGTGLGLALVKSLVEEMGGEVGVESKEREGSTFFAQFPIIAPPAENIEEVTLAGKKWLLADGGETGIESEVDDEQDESAHVQTVLVVDDLEDMRTLIGNALKKKGYKVLKAANGEQGYQVIVDRSPDLVISDWMMPKLSGPDMLKRVRGNPALVGTPFILLTAKSDEESKVIGTEIGADVFLGKPFNEQELTSTVRNLLGLKAREREVVELNQYITESVLKRYLPPTLIHEILEGRISMDKPAEMRQITVLFSDISGFTKASEKLGPLAISAFLNEYLTKMNDIIFEHGGTIDKFIGDAIMVMFGAPQDMPVAEQVRRAADCSLAMQEAMHSINQDWKSEGADHLRMRIGLHHGEAIVGNFGSDKRFDYTAIGPTVNLAARIESSGEAGHVFISHQCRELLPADRSEEAGTFEFKGIEGEHRLYKLVGS